VGARDGRGSRTMQSIGRGPRHRVRWCDSSGKGGGGGAVKGVKDNIDLARVGWTRVTGAKSGRGRRRGGHETCGSTMTG
jgi:hypothetical protein